MVIITKQLNSTNKNYRREKNYYVSIKNNTILKIYYNRHKEKTYIKSNISVTLEHEQIYKMLQKLPTV